MRQRANDYYALQQILLGDEGISAIKKARVLMIGVGGLGCPAAMHLTTTGVGRLTLLDPDVVETSNLHRQTLYRPGDEGLPKVSLAARRLQEINPDVEIVPLQAALNPDNAERLIPEHDLVLDGSDNFATKFLCADACARLGKTLVYAAVFRFQGQLAVFDDQIHYRDLFPHVPDSEMVPDCSDGGTVGAFVALIGTMQAAEAIKIISGVGENLRGKLFVFDTLTFRSFKLTIVPNPENPLRSGRPISPSDYEHRCANIATLAP
ncbi:MAG: HesA/MoeB/ThiF family protein, partial [Bacteroidia bacterium]|nr:HesA/MoeB/ThiF family protein [Bacteroidia bacterium]